MVLNYHKVYPKHRLLDRWVQFYFDKIKSADSKSVSIQQPWSGYLAKKLELAPDEYYLEINHDNGMKSKMHFKGKLLGVNENEALPEGKTIGQLSLDSNSFSWLVDVKNPAGPGKSDSIKR